MTKAQLKAVERFEKAFYANKENNRKGKVFYIHDIYGYIRPHLIGDYGVVVLPENMIPEGFQIGFLQPEEEKTIADFYESVNVSAVVDVDNPKEDILVDCKSANKHCIAFKLARIALALIGKKRALVSYNSDNQFAGAIFEGNGVIVHVLLKRIE